MAKILPLREYVQCCFCDYRVSWDYDTRQAEGKSFMDAVIDAGWSPAPVIAQDTRFIFDARREAFACVECAANYK